MVSNRGPCPSQGLPRLPEAQLGKCMSVSAGLAVMACVCVCVCSFLRARLLTGILQGAGFW